MITFAMYINTTLFLNRHSLPASGQDVTLLLYVGSSDSSRYHVPDVEGKALWAEKYGINCLRLKRSQ